MMGSPGTQRLLYYLSLYIKFDKTCLKMVCPFKLKVITMVFHNRTSISCLLGSFPYKIILISPLLPWIVPHIAF